MAMGLYTGWRLIYGGGGLLHGIMATFDGLIHGGRLVLGGGRLVLGGEAYGRRFVVRSISIYYCQDNITLIWLEAYIKIQSLQDIND